MDTEPQTLASGSFGEQLRRLRVAARMSQDELARRSALSTVGVGALERGTRRAPKEDTLALLADALGLDRLERARLVQAAQRGRARSSRARPLVSETSHNLPVQLTSFVGRADEIAQIARLISTNRLVTVLGPGGVGKTRAVLEVATRLAESGADDIRLIELAPLQDGTFIVGRIASVLGVRLSDANETSESLAQALKARRVLLILDSCEHLIAHATETAQVLLQQCPQIKIVATTRERLGIMGELVYRLPPLAVPDNTCATLAEARACSALELFVQRGLSADPDFTFTDQQARVLVDICKRLEGIPLAIELTAAQLPTLGLRTLSQRLELTLGASRGVQGVPDRHQTMSRTLAWSYDLLIEPERLLLRRLGVFAGGCTLPAAEFVCSEGDVKTSDVAGLLVSLADKSLVNAVIDGATMRYKLFDSTRAFAREQLAEAGEGSAISRRHAQWLAAYGQEAVREYLSKPNLIWLDELLPELDNVCSALEWTLQTQIDGDVLLAGTIAASFRGLWLIPGRFAECRRWIELIVGRIDETQHPQVVADLLIALTTALAGSEKITVFEHIIVLLRRLGDRRRLGRRLLDLARIYSIYGLLNEAQESLDEALQIITEEAMLEPASREASVLKGDIAWVRGGLSVARAQYDDARAEFEKAWGNAKQFGDEFVLAYISIARAEVEFLAGNIALAVEYAEAAVAQANAIPQGSVPKAAALCCNAAVRLSIRDIDGAELAARQAFSLLSLMGDDDLRLISLQNVAAVAAHRGRPQTGARLLGSIEVWIDSTGYRRAPFEDATYKLLVSSLHAQLGAEIETHTAEGRRLNLNVAAEEALSIDFRGSNEMGS